MSQPHLAQDLYGRGYTTGRLASMVKSGDLRKIRHGAYAAGDRPEQSTARHRQLVDGTWPRLGPDAVLSHGSAAVVLGIPVPGVPLDRVHITRAAGGSGRRTRWLHVHRAPLPAEDVIELAGYRLTTPARTAADVASLLAFGRSVEFLDAVLHVAERPGTEDTALRAGIEAVLDDFRGRTGVRTARAALAFADGRSESVLESRSRLFMHRVGIPQPVLQYELLVNGRFVARFDFAWPEHKVFGECDGKNKYGALLRPGETAADAVMREKRRENNAVAAGWRGVRWDWSDLGQPEVLRDRILRVLRT